MTALMWKKFWQVEVPSLTVPQEIGINDMVVMAIVLVDFFQYCAMTPNLSNLSAIVDSLSHMASVRMEEMLEMSEGMYWNLLIGAFVVVFMWILFGAIIIFRLDLRFPESSSCVVFGMVAEFVLPIINNALFLPIISVLLDVFLCTEEIGDEFTDTFLDRDCHEFCWESDHVTYAVMSAIALVAYLP
jgi:hypothetical protein